MDNPNTCGRLRRHNSLPSRWNRRSSSSFLSSRLRMHSNPYVGSFRHSPPTSFSSMEAGYSPSCRAGTYFSSVAPVLRKSPYIGCFRHSPPTKIQLHKIERTKLTYLEKCQKLAMLIDTLPKQKETSCTPDLSQIINGRLRGGGKDDDFYSPNAINSSAVYILSKLCSWFLHPPAIESESYLPYPDADSQCLKVLPSEIAQELGDAICDSDDDDESEVSSCADDEESSVALSDFDGPVRNVPSSYTAEPMKPPLDVSVSDVAEAYYAHQVIDQSEYSELEGHRLDYVITQMDIARMARNASRHLDVDSILSLPTITYQSRASTTSTTRALTDSRGPSEAWSFIMVPQSQKKQAKPTLPSTPEDTCVICMENFVDGDRLRVLPCDHSFHVGCIDKWLSGSHSHLECFTSGCPTCKKNPAAHAEDNNGSVPSWAFARLGAEMARSSSSFTD